MFPSTSLHRRYGELDALKVPFSAYPEAGHYQFIKTLTAECQCMSKPNILGHWCATVTLASRVPCCAKFEYVLHWVRGGPRTYLINQTALAYPAEICALDYESVFGGSAAQICSN